VQLGDRVKSGALFVLFVCPDGIAIAATSLVMELLYRLAIRLNYLGTGLEYLAVSVGFGLFVLILGFRLFSALMGDKNGRR